MDLLLGLTLNPADVLAWINIGLVTGWLAGLVTSRGTVGILVEIGLGLVGALIGGCVAAYYINGSAGFWSGLLIALISACTAIALAHIIVPDRAARRKEPRNLSRADQ